MADSSTMRGIRTSTRSLMTARPHLPERESASPEMIVLRSGYARLGPFNPGPFSSRLTLLSHLDCRRAVAAELSSAAPAKRAALTAEHAAARSPANRRLTSG